MDEDALACAIPPDEDLDVSSSDAGCSSDFGDLEGYDSTSPTTGSARRRRRPQGWLFTTDEATEDEDVQPITTSLLTPVQEITQSAAAAAGAPATSAAPAASAPATPAAPVSAPATPAAVRDPGRTLGLPGLSTQSYVAYGPMRKECDFIQSFPFVHRRSWGVDEKTKQPLVIEPGHIIQ